MKLIADSGTTRTQWRYLGKDGHIKQAATEGMNPWQQQDEQMRRVLKEQLPADFATEVEELWFYGSGCIPGQASDRVHAILSEIFPAAHITVSDDLMGAARGLCGGMPGIACILGTGSNSCAWDGQHIADRVPALGYLLGDEGSASYMGKQVIHAWFKRGMPAHLRDAFEEQYHPDLRQMLQTIYHEPNAGRYLGSYSQFLSAHIKDPWVRQLIYDAFVSFIKHNVQKYAGYDRKSVHFTGSIAYHFANILRQAGQDHGLYVGYITESPIAGLLLYHQEHNLL